MELVLELLHISSHLSITVLSEKITFRILLFFTFCYQLRHFSIKDYIHRQIALDLIYNLIIIKTASIFNNGIIFKTGETFSGTWLKSTTDRHTLSTRTEVRIERLEARIVCELLLASHFLRWCMNRKRGYRKDLLLLGIEIFKD